MAKTRILFSCLCVCSLLLWGCHQKNKINWKTNYNHKNTDPYGLSIVHGSLKSFFPEAKIVTLSRGFRFENINYNMQHPDNGRSLMLLVGNIFNLSANEWQHLSRFINAGNDVALFSNLYQPELSYVVGKYITMNSGDYFVPNSTLPESEQNSVSLNHISNKTFTYKGRGLNPYFQKVDYKEFDKNNNVFSFKGLGDSVVHLGKNNKEDNFLRYQIGKGQLYLHSAPLSLSNYFLLQKENQQYVNGVFNAFANDVSQVYWIDFMKRSDRSGSLSVLLNYPAMRWAFYLSLLAMAMYIFSEIKRRQRAIPILPPKVNSTAVFAETVGQLYYHKNDHRNLGQKMIQHFLEWVRSYYHLPTNHLNDNFIAALSAKSGKEKHEVQELVRCIHHFRIDDNPITETELFILYNTIQDYYP